MDNHQSFVTKDGSSYAHYVVDKSSAGGKYRSRIREIEKIMPEVLARRTRSGEELEIEVEWLRLSP